LKPSDAGPMEGLQRADTDLPALGEGAPAANAPAAILTPNQRGPSAFLTAEFADVPADELRRLLVWLLDHGIRVKCEHDGAYRCYVARHNGGVRFIGRSAPSRLGAIRSAMCELGSG